MEDSISRRGFIKQAATGIAAGAVLPVSAQAQGPAGTSLYARLGGYDALAAVTDDFVGRLVSDRQLARFFAGHSTNSLNRIRQLVVDQLCQATGGPCVYIGRDMKTAHKGLGISESDWQVTARHLTATFDKFKVPERERTEVLALLTSLKGDIVEKA
ncbi:MAG TPA: twin-arginine translocation signal domain-containing protein [bacterium]|nr:twin-arginine translocation signal domain-containing protein [bacterium]